MLFLTDYFSWQASSQIPVKDRKHTYGCRITGKWGVGKYVYSILLHISHSCAMK
jgi:hypothetical protein